MTGHFASYYPGWARRIAARYPICNHTQNHVDLTKLSDAGVRTEVLEGRRTLRRISGRERQPLFRFPYGDDDARTLRLVNRLGYAAVGWTVDTAAWLGTSGGQSVATVVQRALAGLRPGEVILMHAGANPDDRTTLDAATTAIRRIRARGYGLTTLPLAYAAAYPSWRR